MVGTEALFHHSSRVYLFGRLLGQARGLTADPELLYAVALMHDVGLTFASPRADGPTGTVGADILRDLLIADGRPVSLCRSLWDAVAFPDGTASEGESDQEVELFRAGRRADRPGAELAELDRDQIAAVRAAHPVRQSAGCRRLG